MTYFVEGLLRSSPLDNSVRHFGEYDTLESAIKAAQQMIDEFLASKVEAGMTAGDLFSIYKESGEVPFIFCDGARTLNVPEFNHFKLAMLRCNAMCPQAFPPLLSDDEFEVLKQQRLARDRSESQR